VLPFHGRFGLTFPGLLARFFWPFLANFSRHFPLTFSYTRLCYYNDSVLPFHGRFGLTFPGLLARFFWPFLANFSRHFPLTFSYTRLCYYNDAY
jgi:hypothetical protein